MDLAQATKIAQTLSDERFATYLNSPEAAGDPILAMRLYGWNMEVSGAIWGPLHALEVATRNAMHRELAAALERLDWWREPTLVLTQVAVSQIAEAESFLANRTPQPSVGAIVAELPFSFWVSLLGPGVNYEMTLWRPILRHAFPEYAGARKALHKTLNALRVLRNRIAHHEPIFSRDLDLDLDDIKAVIGYVCKNTESWIDSGERASTVLARRSAVIAGTRANYF